MAVAGNQSFYKWLSSFMRGNASFRQSLWKWWYNFLSRKYSNLTEWTCMNYGYLPEGFVGSAAHEEVSKNLYQQVVNGVNISDKDVLEVGCGRGGGLHHLHERFSPKASVGLDLSHRSISFCNKRFPDKGLRYIQGSADDLPLDSDTMDTLINVESSHTYPDFDAFVKEACRVLKPGGHFCYADFRQAEKVDSIKKSIESAGFQIEVYNDISSNVLLALKADEPNRDELIKAHVPWWMRTTVKQFAGVPGSKFFTDLSSGETVYMHIISRKI
ncbi:MAG: methyltransferase domain-containing protein [Bacteroidetes bacterium]|nr:methyltransferase domain-containing protein [Bacteroidota bacterium]